MLRWPGLIELRDFLKSRKSISNFRRGVYSGDLAYFLDIEIDPYGRLPWPDMSDFWSNSSVEG